MSEAQELRAAAERSRADAKRLETEARQAWDTARAFERQAAQLQMAEAAATPVDRSCTTLADGNPVTPDHREIKQNGQQKDYVVLCADERAKGFVRPVRRSYVHQKCGVRTTMSQSIAETYARDPAFYSGTFCCGCGTHFPVGETGEFVWDGSQEKVGT